MEQELLQSVKTICTKILQMAGVSAKVNTAIVIGDDEETKIIKVSIQTEDGGALIGYKGNNLAALQFLLAYIHRDKNPNNTPIIVDVNDYKSELQEKLSRLAKNAAEEVKQTGKSKSLGKYPPFERRVIHMTIAQIEGVTTESVGEGRLKDIIIKNE